MKKKIFLLFLIALVAGLVWLAVDVQRSVFRPAARFSPKTIVIPAGASVNRIARLLHEEGVISRPAYFYWYYRLFFRHKMLKSGEYFFDRSMTMKEVIEKLNEGKVVLQKVTFREGMTIKEMARTFEEAGLIPFADFIAAAGDISLIQDLDGAASDLEGYLFPDTYMVRKDTSAEEMLKLMVENFKKQFQTSLVSRCRDIGFSVRQAVTLASLIEKETASPDERFLISSVFHNRLRRHMTLDCDPTIVYALERKNLHDGKLGWNDLKYDSPYNTRLHRGLPPGPICNPGIAALESALYPADTNYLYFVSRDGRVHYFSESLQEHNRAVRKYIIQHNAGISR